MPLPPSSAASTRPSLRYACLLSDPCVLLREALPPPVRWALPFNSPRRDLPVLLLLSLAKRGRLSSLGCIFMFKDVKLYALVWVWACMYGRACGLTGPQRFGDLVLIVDDDMDARAHRPPSLRR